MNIKCLCQLLQSLSLPLLPFSIVSYDLISVDSVFDAEEEGIKKHVFRSNSIVNIVNINWLKDFQVEPTSTSMRVDF